MDMNSSKTQYFNALTGLRFLAATLVFIYHNRKYWRTDLHPEALRFINEFHIGVSLFFVLSGFLIAYTYKDEPLKSLQKYSQYLLLRLARIMPMYWLILTVYYLDPRFGNYKFSSLTYSLFHAFSSTRNLDGIAQAWSLNVEMCFYLLAPLFFLLLRKRFIYFITALLFVFATTVLTGVIWNYYGNPNHFFTPVKFVVNGTFAGRSVQFLTGMLLAYGLRENKFAFFFRIKRKTLWGFFALLIITYSIGLFEKNIYVSGDETVPGMILHALILPFGIAFIIAGLMTEKTWIQKFFGSRFLVLLGNASFTFYLIHISYVSIKIRQLVLLPDRNFILLWVVSIVIYLFIEKPLYTLCRKWIAKIPMLTSRLKTQ